MIVTSPTSVWVMPDTNRPGGSAAWPNHPRPSRAPWTTAGPSVCPPVPSGRVASSWPGRRWSGFPGSIKRRCPSRETDDVRSVLADAAASPPLSTRPRPIGIPVEQFQRHGASPVGSMNAATWVNCGPYIGGTLVVYDCNTANRNSSRLMGRERLAEQIPCLAAPLQEAIWPVDPHKSQKQWEERADQLLHRGLPETRTPPSTRAMTRARRYPESSVTSRWTAST